MSIQLTEEHKMTAQLCNSILQTAHWLDMGKLVEIVRYGKEYDNVGSIIEPTGWMNQHPTNQANTEIYEAVLILKRTLNQIIDRHGLEDLHG